MKKTKREWFKGSDYNLCDRLMFGTWAVIGIAILAFVTICCIYGAPEFWCYTMR